MVKPAHGVFIQSVSDGASLPLWRRVHGAVRSAIEGGALAAGARLPSARQLARDWRVARGAVDQAFEQLQLEGLVRRRIGDGTYVEAGAGDAAGQPPPTQRKPAALARDVLASHAAGSGADAATAAGASVSPGQRTATAPGGRPECAFAAQRPPLLHPRGTDLDGFPLDAWRRLLVASAAERSRDLLAEVPPAGLPGLRAAIARHLALQRGIACRPEQVMVLASPGEGLNLMLRVLQPQGSPVFVEDPSHPSLPWLLRSLGADVHGVPVDGQGFDVQALRAADALLARSRPSAADAPPLVYLHPLVQYPLGRRTSVERGDALLAWARQRRAWVIEALFNDELWPRDAQPPALHRRDADRVLVLGTFEGVMFPSLRVAYLVVPTALCAPFADAMTFWTARCPACTQWALAEFIDSGQLALHLHAQRRRLAERRALIEREWLPALRAATSALHAGPLTPAPHLCLHLGAGVDDVVLARSLLHLGLAPQPLSQSVVSAGDTAIARRGLVVGYADGDPTALLHALDRLGTALASAGAAVPPPVISPR